VYAQDLSRTLGAVDDGRVVGTLESFPAELSLPGATALVADAISAVTVQPTHRRRGLLTRMITADLCAARERGEPASILIAAEYPIYGRFGFGPATEMAAYSLERSLVRFTRQAPGQVDLVEPARMRELAPGIFDRCRRDRPGQIDRSRHSSWDRRLGLGGPPWMRDQKPPRCGLYTSPSGEPEGYVLYRVDDCWERHVPKAKLDIVELMAVSPDAYLRLWRYCCEVDLVKEITAEMRCVDEPLRWLLDNPRVALHQTMRADMLWLRPLDVPTTLAARRYLCDGRLVIDVADPLGLSAGRFLLEGGPGGASCQPTTATTDVRLGMTALGSITLGGVSLHLLADAALIEEERPGGIDAAERLFRWSVTPWCSTFF
jgi:predicted acetyltransferase